MALVAFYRSEGGQDFFETCERFSFFLSFLWVQGGPGVLVVCERGGV